LLSEKLQFINKKYKHNTMSTTLSNFISQATQIARKNMFAEKYTISEFANELAVSKSALNKKMKLLTGQTPNEFIENIKLNYAQKLISDTDLSVKEVAYSSGFNDPKYFARRFKKIFGLTPKEYKITTKKKIEIFWNYFVMN